MKKTLKKRALPAIIAAGLALCALSMTGLSLTGCPEPEAETNSGANTTPRCRRFHL